MRKTITSALWKCTLLCLLTVNAALGQTVQSHTVIKGETLYGISKQYDLSVQELVQQNPQAAEGIKPGMILKIQAPSPSGKSESPEEKERIHQVKSSETIYRIARMYSVSVDALIKANSDIAIEDMDVGTLLTIPASTARDTNKRATLDTTQFTTHKVKKGQTAYSLSKQYNISLDSLYHFNPKAQKGLFIGQVLVLPKIEKTVTPEVKLPPGAPSEQLSSDENNQSKKPLTIADTAGLNSKFFFYKVKTGDSFYALKNKYNATQEELEKLNPELREGLKLGQYIIIPKKENNKELGFLERLFKKVEEKPTPKPSNQDKELKEQLNEEKGRFSDTTAGEIFEKTAIDDSIKVDTSLPVRVGLMLPFFTLDSNATLNQENKYRVSKRSKVGLDFYHGFLMAADSMARADFPVLLDVMNTHNQRDSVKNLLQQRASVRYDLMVGPLYGDLVEYVADYFGQKKVPVVSPLSNAVQVKNRPNLINLIPPNSRQEAVIAGAINARYPNHRVIFVHKGLPEEQRQVIQIKSRLQSRADTGFLDDVVLTEEMLKRNRLRDFVSDNEDELFVMLSEDQVFINDMVNKLQSLNDTTLCVVSSNKTLQLPTISYQYLEALEIATPGIHYVDYQSEITQDFVASFRATFHYEPSRFALQGYDVGLFFLRQLQLHPTYFLESLSKAEPQRMLNSGFSLQKLEDGGYQNKFMYLTGVRDMKLVLLETYKR